MKLSTVPRRRLPALLALLVAACAPARPPAAPVPGPDAAGVRHYLFAYFEGNGEDGLHLAHSTGGLTWAALRGDSSFLTPAVGTERLMRDPSILRGPDGLFHMVWTSGWNEKGIGYASSPDLVHWSPQRFLPVMEHEPATRNSWAPELFYDDATGEYLIFWASTIPGRYPATDGQGASATSPGYNHRIYYVATRDFESFTPTRLLYEPGFSAIDATIYRDGDRYVMFVKDETGPPFPAQKNLHVATAEHATGPWSAPSPAITGKEWVEGPTALRIDGRWHLYYDRYTEHRDGLIVSEDLVHWTDWTDRLRVPSGIRHGTAFPVDPEVAEALVGGI